MSYVQFEEDVIDPDYDDDVYEGYGDYEDFFPINEDSCDDSSYDAVFAKESKEKKVKSIGKCLNSRDVNSFELDELMLEDSEVD